MLRSLYTNVFNLKYAMSENITTVLRDRNITPDTVLKDSVEGTWSKENWSAPNLG